MFIFGGIMNTIVNVVETGVPTQFTQMARRKQNAESKIPGLNETESGRNAEEARLAQNADKELANLERISRAFNKKLQFVINHESSEITINVIDPDTDKVIKVLPPEELQRLNRKIEEAIGFLFDEKV
jgi:flagellar protein FlaG